MLFSNNHIQCLPLALRGGDDLNVYVKNSLACTQGIDIHFIELFLLH